MHLTSLSVENFSPLNSASVWRVTFLFQFGGNLIDLTGKFQPLSIRSGLDSQISAEYP